MRQTLASSDDASISGSTAGGADSETYRFRPWVRRAGLSILLVAAGSTAACLIALASTRAGRYGWPGEATIWLYIAVLWAGGLKVTLGTRKAVAELLGDAIVLRPLHAFGVRRIAWDDLLGTEQMIGGDRLIVYYNGRSGMRFVALNLNLVKGRADFMRRLERRLLEERFRETVVNRSRYLSRPGSAHRAGE